MRPSENPPALVLVAEQLLFDSVSQLRDDMDVVAGSRRAPRHGRSEAACTRNCRAIRDFCFAWRRRRTLSLC